MKTSDYFYDLPKELIAQHPASPRDSSRLLVYHPTTQKVEHRHFYDLPKYLRKGDVLVVNDSKVIPARLYGHREGHEGVVEVLLLKRLNYTDWECITRPAKKLKVGTVVQFAEGLCAEVIGYGEEGIRHLSFHFEGVFEEVLDKVGQMPLPPYITEQLADRTRYQTVYCREAGSAAAPTAGLHFTPELLDIIKQKGVEIVDVMLHVGLGTFRPVKEDDPLKHKMHNEFYHISEASAAAINRAVDEGRRIICVGTTSVRTLESAADETGHVRAGSANTEIFIYPGYQWKVVKGLVTNFHLPESTLIMLVSALLGREETLALYELAVREKYRFFSFGDAMLLLDGEEKDEE